MEFFFVLKFNTVKPGQLGGSQEAALFTTGRLSREGGGRRGRGGKDKVGNQAMPYSMCIIAWFTSEEWDRQLVENLFQSQGKLIKTDS